MLVDIYKSTKNGSKYLTVPAGTDISDMTFPADLDSDLLDLSPFKTELELDPQQPRIGIDAKDVLRQVDENGFAVHSTKVTITVSTSQ